MFGMIVTSTLSGQLVSRTGRYKGLILGGALVATVALGLSSTLGTATPLWVAAGLMVLLGVGLGPVNSQLTLVVQNAAPRRELGGATSGNQFFRQIGGTLAVSLFGALVNAQLASQLAARLPAQAQALPAAVQDALASPNLLTSPQATAQLQEALARLGTPDLFGPILTALRGAMATAIDHVFLIAAVLVGLAFLVMLALPERPLAGRSAPREGDMAPATD